MRLKRPPDFVIERSDGSPYLRRWWVIPRNRWFNIYLHNMQGDDDDRAMHDHPWINVSIVLKGGYWEIVPYSPDVPFITKKFWRGPGSIVFRMPKAAHRLVLPNAGARSWSLFLTGPNVRTWGFHCPQGWVDWKTFTDPTNYGRAGKGCAE